MGIFTSDFSLMLLRVATGLLMIFPHGWSKAVGFAEKMHTFPDPLGIGSAASLGGAVFSEVICQVLIILGVKVRWFSIPAIFTMFIAAFVVHGNDPWANKEKAVMYLVLYIVIFISGGGKHGLTK